MSIALKQVFNKDKTFRPKRKFEPGTQRFELHKRAQASLNSGVDLKAAVQLPSGEDQNDWVAVHVVDFFNRINLIYGTICEFCTERTCPVMSGGPKYEYRWQDDMKYKKPTALPAPQYMNLLMDWIEVQINNEDIFPTSVGVPFPKNFLQICKKILCRLFRVFVHVYIHHFDRIILMGAEAHVNTCYKHFYYFVTELNLIDRKELEPLWFHGISFDWPRTVHDDPQQVIPIAPKYQNPASYAWYIALHSLQKRDDNQDVSLKSYPLKKSKVQFSSYCRVQEHDSPRGLSLLVNA
ncbi:PREDICTED: MOB kinase activator 3B [Charadrius vociferus]|uniref:MOB kinase activator 3B n=1 Tax=Charadrius vociferus TaxID=50402 RepID=UPI0005218231|nr:PREDICTED: MOB kinase activator 3B [Charadrius vociferus]